MRQLVNLSYKSRSLKKLNPDIQLNKKFLIPVLMQTGDIYTAMQIESISWFGMLNSVKARVKLNLGAAQQTIFPTKSKFSVKIV